MDVAPLAASMVETTLCGVKVKPEKQYWPGPACVKFAAVSPDDPAASNVPSALMWAYATALPAGQNPPRALGGAYATALPAGPAGPASPTGPRRPRRPCRVLTARFVSFFA